MHTSYDKKLCSAVIITFVVKKLFINFQSHFRILAVFDFKKGYL